MTDLESRLRESFSHQVTAPPPVPDLPDTVVRRGRRARHRRAGASVVAAIALVSGGLVLVDRPGSDRQSLQPGGPTGVAPRGFLDGYGLGSGDEETVAYGVGERAVFPGQVKDVSGVAGTVVVAKRARAGVVYLSDEAGRQALQLLDEKGSVHPLAEDVTGLAVSPSGAQVAFQPSGTVDLVVLDVASGSQVLRRALGISAQPVAWIGTEVLLSVDDLGTRNVRAWSTVTGKVRPVGGNAYSEALGAAAGTDLVALRRAADGCVTVSHLAERADLWSDCDHDFVGFSPGGGSVLLRDGSSVVVRDALTGDLLGSPHLPRTGVLAAGLLTDDTVLALVRGTLGDGNLSVAAVSCPAAGDSACLYLRSTGDAEHAWVAGARPLDP